MTSEQQAWYAMVVSIALMGLSIALMGWVSFQFFTEFFVTVGVCDMADCVKVLVAGIFCGVSCLVTIWCFVGMVRAGW